MHITRTVSAALAAVVISAAAFGSAGIAQAATTAAAGTFYGDPGTAAQFWVEQNFDDCLLMSAADVVGQLTGDQPTEEEIIAVASQTPSSQHPGTIYVKPADPDNGFGTDGEDLPALLAHYGVDAQYTDTDVAAAGGPATGIAALEDYLGNGRNVIAYVNSATIWGVDGDLDSNDHALVVTGIDTARSLVHLNDSGTPNGADEQVSLDCFRLAWDTGNDSMVVTTAAA